MAKRRKRNEEFVPLSRETMEKVFRTCAAALDHRPFLSPFEASIVTDFAMRYGRFGDRTNVTPRQLWAFYRIAVKLFLPLAEGWKVPEADDDDDPEEHDP